MRQERVEKARVILSHEGYKKKTEAGRKRVLEILVAGGLTTEDLQNLVAESQSDIMLRLKGMALTGKIQTSGSYVEIQFPQLDQDQLFLLAQDYVGSKGLKWEIRKPYAWTDYDSMPHITLHPSMKKYFGEDVTVRLGEIYHFTAGRSHWVVVHADLPSKFKCEYACHLSIGQRRIS